MAGITQLIGRLTFKKSDGSNEVNIGVVKIEDNKFYSLTDILEKVMSSDINLVRIALRKLGMDEVLHKMGALRKDGGEWYINSLPFERYLQELNKIEEAYIEIFIEDFIKSKGERDQ